MYTNNNQTFFNTDNNIIKKISKIPFGLFFTILLLASVGFVMLYSAARGHIKPWALNQAAYFALFSLVMFAVAAMNLRTIFHFSYLLYFASLTMLLLLELLGHTAMGATRWLNLGFVKLQPAEPMKICLVLALAKYFHNLPINKIGKIRSLIAPIIMVLAPSILIIKQPDLGTGMILILLGGMIFFLAGVRIWKFLLIIGSAIISMPIIWHFLREYQKKRILIFLNPDNDHLGSGYNIIQSKIAIGSGGFFGRGLMNGPQSQLQFLPEHQTDFIFTMILEELGFIGGFYVLLLFAIILLYLLKIALNCKNHFARLVTLGIAALLFLHVAINTAMVMELVPVVGVPLPLLSYGRTMMFSILVGFGLAMNCWINRNIAIGS